VELYINGTDIVVVLVEAGIPKREKPETEIGQVTQPEEEEVELELLDFS
jgi:hypothetical protein